MSIAEAYPAKKTELSINSIDTVRGVEWQHVEVDDIYNNDSPEALALRQQIARWDMMIRADESMQVYPSQVSEAVYANPAMAEWSKLMPSALALWPLQRPLDDRLPAGEDLPNGADIDDQSRNFFLYSHDAIGMRSRATVFASVTARALDSLPVGNDRPVRWMSVASGAAVPVGDALSITNYPNEIHVDLVDISEDAQRMAAGVIADIDKPNVTFEPHYENVVRGLVVGDTLVDRLQAREDVDVLDALGIFEYIGNPKKAVEFAHNLYSMLRPGGTMVIGNMLDTHPDLAFNRYGIGWPSIYPRSKEEIVDILLTAGIQPEDMTVYEPADGVYAVVDIKKPVENGWGA